MPVPALPACPAAHHRPARVRVTADVEKRSVSMAAVTSGWSSTCRMPRRTRRNGWARAGTRRHVPGTYRPDCRARPSPAGSSVASPGGPALFGSTNPVFYKVLAVRIGHHRDCGALVETRRHFGNLDCDLIPYRWAFLSFDTVADAVAQLIPQDQLTRHGGGAAEAQEQQDGAEQLRQQRVPEVRRVDREPPARAGTARRRETLRPLPDHRAQPA